MRYIFVMISIVIPFFNDWKRLSISLDLLLKYARNVDCHIEIIAVDNSSVSHVSLPEELSSVRLLRCEKPGSYAARNVGIRGSRGNTIVFTDSDCLPGPEFLEEICSFYRNGDREHVITAGKVTIFPEVIGRETFAEAYDCMFGLPQKSYVSRGYGVTANLAIPKKAFLEVGMFDEDRFSGGDADICKRAAKAGYKVLYNEKAEVLHPARKTLQELISKQNRMMGAQVDRAGFMGIGWLILKGFGRAFLSCFELFFRSGRMGVKLKAFLVLIIVLCVRNYYIIYHCIPGSIKHR